MKRVISVRNLRNGCANLIFFSCSFDSDRIYKQLSALGIVVKFEQSPPDVRFMFRVAPGNREENTAFLTALKVLSFEQGA